MEEEALLAPAEEAAEAEAGAPSAPSALPAVAAPSAPSAPLAASAPSAPVLERRARSTWAEQRTYPTLLLNIYICI